MQITMSEIDYKQARFNMVEQQIRTWDVLDQRVLDVMMDVPRDAFVADKHRRLAYSDVPLPLPHGQAMMHPKMEARMLQALDVQPGDKILEVGTGSGYVAALLAKLGKHVYSVEIHQDLLRSAAERLKAQGIGNVTLEEGDAANGWETHAPYDVIAITGSMAALPEAFKHNLSVGGRLFVVVGEHPVMEALLITRTGQNEWATESLFETDLPRLENAERPQQFVF